MSEPRHPLPPELEGLEEFRQAYQDQVAAPDAQRAARRARLLAALPQAQAQAEPVLQTAGPAAPKSTQGRSLLPWALGAGLLIGVLGALLPWRGGSVQPDWRLAQQAPAPVAQPEAASVAPAASAVQMAQAPAEPVPAAAAPVLADQAAPPRARSAPQALPATAPAKPAVAAAPAIEPPVEARPANVAMASSSPAAPAAPAAQAGPAAEQAAERVAMAEPMAKKAEAQAHSVEARDRQAPSMVSMTPAPPVARSGLDLASGLAGQPLDAPDAQGRTALMRAALLGQVEAVEALLRQGANPRLRDREGLDAAALAERAGHKALAAQLRAAAASAPQP